ncbi:MAG: glucose-6-phosphate isomerase [Propionibacteriaceae bacterium]|jgi:glucose-6-phosphate isomerase|nr:glucose-6-phosphate isomerase [Propionibacteriaceae bacterium]
MQMLDPTETASWKRLAELASQFRPDLPGWFEADPQRVSSWTFDIGDLHVDLSKSLVTDEIRARLIELADDMDLAARRDAMFAGEVINTTEQRSVLHTALRRPAGDQLLVDGVDVVGEVQEVLDRVYRFADSVRDGSWVGVTGRRIKTVVNIGIGGSDLGPAMVCEALRPYSDVDIDCRFISNIDPTDLFEQTHDLDPETTLFIIVSKSFDTLETLTNSRLARAWLWRELVSQGAIADDDQERMAAVAKHFVAVSTELDKVAAFGIDPANTFGFWDWVGGRYSVDSAVGTIIAVAIGPEGFAKFLDGFHQIDQAFCDLPWEKNLPALMGLINVWYRDFLNLPSHAVLPYNQYLDRFPAYLQQLTMESNGKRVRWDGQAVAWATGEVFWGEPGTNGQHAFYQLLHQGTQVVPADFIGFVNPAHPLTDGDVDVHQLFLANCLAQTQALAFGKTADQVRAEGTPERLVAHRTFPGNRPTATIMAPALTPSVLGQLIALYEHITFTQGVIWQIDSFDQWGVELGKKLALAIAPALAGDRPSLASQDASTQALIGYYQQTRKH